MILFKIFGLDQFMERNKEIQCLVILCETSMSCQLCKGAAETKLCFKIQNGKLVQQRVMQLGSNLLLAALQDCSGRWKRRASVVLRQVVW